MRTLLLSEGDGIWENIVPSLHLGWPRSEVVLASTSDSRVSRILSDGIDLVVFRLETGGAESFAGIRRVRDFFGGGLIAVSDHPSDSDLIEALDAGADDFMVIPLNPALFVARARAIVRGRNNDQTPDMLRSRKGEVIVDPNRHEIRVREALLQLTLMEFDVLVHLVRFGDSVARKEALCSSIWGYHGSAEDVALRKHIQVLRRKLRGVADSSVSIETVPGIGYRLVEASSGSAA